MARIGKQSRFRAVTNSEDEWGATASLLTALWCEVFSEVGRPIAPEGDAVILVTKKDGTTTALNVDRIERVELNPVSLGREIERLPRRRDPSRRRRTSGGRHRPDRRRQGPHHGSCVRHAREELERPW